MAEDEEDSGCGARTGGDCMSEEEVDYNVMGSFPASDPPSWTLGVRPHKTSRHTFGGEPPSAQDPSHQNEVEPPEDSAADAEAPPPPPEYEI